MTTDRDDELGEILRRALRAEAEDVVPSGDGLERIRERIADRPPRRFALPWLDVPWLRATWVRPALAVGAAVLVAGFGVSAPQTIGFIQTSVNGPERHGGDGQRDHSLADGGRGLPGAPTDAPSGGTALGTPSSTGPPATASSTGAPTCPPAPPATPPASPSAPAKTAARHQDREADECPRRSTPPASPTTPATPHPTDPPPTTPPTTPTPPPTEPAATNAENTPAG
ncbi:hypothetical protein [Actinomadura atramentaria]|uniref:hypothetical protein n=1 Tax=Actinomadura atramentaria TaxID=1990 RepID=UPI0003A20004|nr:hypothetical protein [Actinomadura atramentaria]